MTKHPRIKKIIFIILFLVAIIGFASYEAYSITKKEYERQTEIAGELHKDINTNLDMLKVAVQTGDQNIYAEKLINIFNDSNELKSLSLIQDKESEYLASLDEYIGILKERANLLVEIAKLKTDVLNIESTFKDNYSNKETITREKLTELGDKIKKLKLDEKSYAEEATTNIVKNIDSLIDGIADKSNALTECIDECYADRINEINDELADIIKNFADQTNKLNRSLEEQFNFDKMNRLKQFRLY